MRIQTCLPITATTTTVLKTVFPGPAALLCHSLSAYASYAAAAVCANVYYFHSLQVPESQILPQVIVHLVPRRATIWYAYVGRVTNSTLVDPSRDSIGRWDPQNVCLSESVAQEWPVLKSLRLSDLTANSVSFVMDVSRRKCVAPHSNTAGERADVHRISICMWPLSVVHTRPASPPAKTCIAAIVSSSQPVCQLHDWSCGVADSVCSCAAGLDRTSDCR